MCGILGFYASKGCLPAVEIFAEALDRLKLRGPDDHGVWREDAIVLGHRRLAVVDVSPTGRQPMESYDRRYVIVFNGEIYNHDLIRRQLEGAARSPNWRGHSDTESLLAGFEAWGIQETVERSIGMFAFAVWDKEARVLTLGRDRVGEKPLYYGWQGNSFLFGSEIKALRAHPHFQGKIDRQALCLLMRHNCIPAPYSIFEGIRKLPPGCLLTVSTHQREPKIWRYWSAEIVASAGAANEFVDDDRQTIEELEILLKDAVRRQMMADVPLGAFLSGGVDSSTIVALMQMQSSRPVRTFTIGFHEAGYNEAKCAKEVARHLGTDHTELYVTAEEAMAVIPLLPTLYDEPFADSSQIPTFLVSKLARRHVTVSLSGDAGDELFGGYQRYKATATLWRNLAAMPMPVRKIVRELLSGISVQNLNRIANGIGSFLPRRVTEVSNLGERLHKSADVLTSTSSTELYLALVSHWREPASLVIDTKEPDNNPFKTDLSHLHGLSDVQRMMLLDLVSYLPDDILVKVDRAAMGVSLESRVPFLDHRVVEFAWRIPFSMKIRNGQSKWALRQILYKHVPKEMIDRPKSGFTIPIDSWLRGPLRDWAETLLDERRLRTEGFFEATPIRKLWTEHLSGRKNWQFHLWDVLMFQSWLDSLVGGAP